MPLLFQQMIYRADVQRNPHALYVFGDNLQEMGLGGQAVELRGEPNSVGLPTKRAPRWDRSAFFSDADLQEVKSVALPRLRRLYAHLRIGGIVVWPAALPEPVNAWISGSHRPRGT